MNINDYIIAYKIVDQRNKCNIIYALDSDYFIRYKYIDKQTHHEIIDTIFDKDIKKIINGLPSDIAKEVGFCLLEKRRLLQEINTYTRITVAWVI